MFEREILYNIPTRGSHPESKNRTLHSMQAQEIQNSGKNLVQVSVLVVKKYVNYEKFNVKLSLKIVIPVII